MSKYKVGDTVCSLGDEAISDIFGECPSVGLTGEVAYIHDDGDLLVDFGDQATDWGNDGFPFTGVVAGKHTHWWLKQSEVEAV
jgi:hypothetical protein